MGEMHDMYGEWDDGEYNPMDGDDDGPRGVCVNCGADFSYPVARLYCTDLCSDEASLVRYVRGCDADGRSEDPDVLDAINIKFAHVLGGGYDWRGRQLSTDVRAAVTARDLGKCQMCGEPATEIDHIADGSNDTGNLQLLCHRCHVEKTLASRRTVTPDDEEYPEVNAKARELEERFYSPKPLRECDDPDGWPEKQKDLMKERRAQWKESGW